MSAPKVTSNFFSKSGIQKDQEPLAKNAAEGAETQGVAREQNSGIPL